MSLLLLLLQLASTQFAHCETISLREAEEIAEASSFELKVLRAEQAAAREVESTRFRDYLPQAGISYRQNRSIAARDFDTGSYSVQVNVTQPVYDGGRTSLAHEIAGIDIRLAREKYRMEKSRIRLRAREAYLRLQQNSAAKSLAEENLKSARSMLERAKLRLRLGEMALLDFREIENREAGHALELRRREDAYRDSLYDFSAVLRRPADGLSTAPVDLFSLEQKTPPQESELTARALEKRPDLREARIELERARREYLITEYYYLPTVALTGRYGKTGDKWPPQTAEWGVGVNVTFNIFGSVLSTDAQSNRTPSGTSQGFSSGGRLDIYSNPAYDDAQIRNEIELARAKEKKEQLLAHLEETVRRERRGLERSREELELLEKSLAVRENRFLVSSLRYERGELSLDRLLEDELALISERYRLIESRVNYILSCGKLELGLGLELDELALFHLPPGSHDADRRAWKSRFRQENKNETL